MGINRKWLTEVWVEVIQGIYLIERVKSERFGKSITSFECLGPLMHRCLYILGFTGFSTVCTPSGVKGLFEKGVNDENEQIRKKQTKKTVTIVFSC